MNTPDPTMRRAQFEKRRNHSGFTLLELLSVLAVVGLLSALLLPSLHAAHVAAGRARTRVLFNQWIAALESFRTEYGCYPALHESHLVNPPGQNTDPASLHLFHDVLAARRRDGSALPDWTASADPRFPEAQNRRQIAFHIFPPGELTPDALLRDTFDNTEIAVLVDRNLDGWINAADFGDTLPAVAGLRPAAADFPAAGVQAGVLFYSPAPGATAQHPDFLFSWK